MGRKASVQLVGEQYIAKLGTIVGQHSPILLLRWRKQAEIEFSRGVFNFRKPKKQDIFLRYPTVNFTLIKNNIRCRQIAE